MKPYPDLVPHQLYVVVYPEDRWVFFHAVDEDVGLEYHLSKYRGRWHCSTLYMTVHDIAQLCGVVIQLGECY